MMGEQTHQIRQLPLCEAEWAEFAELWNSGQGAAESREPWGGRRRLLQSLSEGPGVSIAIWKPPQHLQRRDTARS